MMGQLSLLDELADGSVEWLEPSFDPETGTVNYSNVERSETTNGKRLPRALETLATEGVLEEEFVRRVIACPDCGSEELDFLLSCPECGSSNTNEVSLLEHTECGCVQPQEQFETDGSYRCPECDADIESLEAACERVETVQQCHECGERSEALDHRLDCVDCHTYTPEEAHTTVLYRYRFDESRRSWLDDLLTARDGVTDALKAHEYDVQRNVVLSGESNDEYVVDLYATDPVFGVEIVVSIRESANGDHIDSLGTIAEATGTHPVMVTTSATRNETAVDLAANNGIQILQVDGDGNAEPASQSSHNLDRRTAFQSILSRVTGTDDSATAESR